MAGLFPMISQAGGPILGASAMSAGAAALGVPQFYGAAVAPTGDSYTTIAISGLHAGTPSFSVPTLLAGAQDSSGAPSSGDSGDIGGVGGPPSGGGPGDTKVSWMTASLSRLRAFYAHFPGRTFPEVPVSPTETQYVLAMADILGSLTQAIELNVKSFSGGQHEFGRAYQGDGIFTRPYRYEFAEALVAEILLARERGIDVVEKIANPPRDAAGAGTAAHDALTASAIRHSWEVLRSCLNARPVGWLSPVFRAEHRPDDVRWMVFKDRVIMRLREIFIIKNEPSHIFSGGELDSLLPEGLAGVGDDEFALRFLRVVLAVGVKLHERAIAIKARKGLFKWVELYDLGNIDLVTARLIHAAEFIHGVFQIMNCYAFDPLAIMEGVSSGGTESMPSRGDVHKALVWLGSVLTARPKGWIPAISHPYGGRPPTPPPIPAPRKP